MLWSELTKPLEGKSGLALDRVRTDLHRLSRLHLRQVVIETQHQHRTLLRRQTSQCLIERQTINNTGLRARRGLRWQRFNVVRRERPIAQSTTPQPIDKPAIHDPPHIRLRVGVIDRPPPSNHIDIRVLKKVLRSGFTSRQQEGRPRQRQTTRSNELTQVRPLVQIAHPGPLPSPYIRSREPQRVGSRGNLADHPV